MDPYDMEKGICGSYSEASFRIPLYKVGSPHHSSDVYRHGAHNRVLLGTSFHIQDLDSKESVSSSPHTGMTL